MNRLLLSLLVLFIGSSLSKADDAPVYQDRWVYVATNLYVPKNVDDLEALIVRAAKAGYNGIVLTDSKLSYLDSVIEAYPKNVARILKVAEANKIEIIPCIFPIGWCPELLMHNPNLAEGVPVVDAPYVVKGTVAIASDKPAWLNGNLEQVKDHRFVGYGYQDGPGKNTVADSAEHHSGRLSCRIQDTVGQKTEDENSRLLQKVKLRPFTCYRLSAWVKTKDFGKGNFNLVALGKQPLTFYDSALAPTQEWTRKQVIFNSLDQSDVTLYAGVWGRCTGTLWIDDFELEELGPINILRRKECPFKVTSADGKMIYEEGKDFLPFADPNLNKDPHVGNYGFDHPAPLLTLTPDSRIKDGNKLRLSWYHPLQANEGQVTISLTAPAADKLLEDQATRVHALFHAKRYFMQHDEIRVGNWDEGATGKTAGQNLSAQIARCLKILKKVAPESTAVVWSDMFDPHHNAVEHYYLNRGGMVGSWEGLDPSMQIANWNSGHAAESLTWFAKRGHQQILAGYYDEPGLSNFSKWDEAARKINGVRGFMYTTWQGNYTQLEAYGKAINRK